jgi:hypothetical protein
MGVLTYYIKRSSQEERGEYKDRGEGYEVTPHVILTRKKKVVNKR